jgi:hypothetical protein
MSESGRELAFQVRFNLVAGTIKRSGVEVGHVTGIAIIPLAAYFRAYPPPGGYWYSPPDPSGGIEEIILETMGHIDVGALLPTISCPAEWKVIPQELVDDLLLEAELVFENIEADDEYLSNEPDDMEDARRRFEGTWLLNIRFPLGFSFNRDDLQVSLDRRDYELDGRQAQLVKK